MASDGEISCANDPNFAVIYSFLKIFGKLYGLEIPTIVKLQELIENTQEVLDPLKDLHLRLLRRAQKSVTSNRWERSMIKFCHQQGHHQEAWEIERFSYKKASTHVKLKVLKFLLEHQFTCHPKFKNAVNALTCKDLRLDPIGRDKNGCVYWLQVDYEANLCLYREDQDEETWQLVARNREELVKVIAQLKSGEDVCPLTTATVNEDSNSAEIPSKFLTPECNKTSDVDGDDNEEEFLSPESESEQEADEHTEEKLLQKPAAVANVASINSKTCNENIDIDETNTIINKKQISVETEKVYSKKEQIPEGTDIKECLEHKDQKDDAKDEELGEVIEEPVMIVTGEGNGVECECSLLELDASFIIGEEISEPVMYFYGEGWGYDNDTGNPEILSQENNHDENTAEENGNKDSINGEHVNKFSQSSNNKKIVKNAKLQNTIPSVTRRSLKKQSNDTTEVLSVDCKKQCTRGSDKSDASNSTKNTQNDSIHEAIVKNATVGESKKNNIRKGRRKIKKKSNSAKNRKHKNSDLVNSQIDNHHDSKTSIIEKRKSSVSSVDHEDTIITENEKAQSSHFELKVEDPLPPKKLRLESTPESDVDTHSKEIKDNNVDGNESEKDIVKKTAMTVMQRKKIKVNKGKFKRKKELKTEDKLDGNSDKDTATGDNDQKESKSLKRSLSVTMVSGSNKSESQSESDDDKPVTCGKRLKIKPKKIMTSTRKKVEAKLLAKQSSDESEEESLYSIAGKNQSRKLVKKKSKMKEKDKHEKVKTGLASEESDLAPVRQSRRIAQMKIKEEAERRHMEEVALREMKKIHKKKAKDDDEEEWVASAASSCEGTRRRRQPTGWRSDSTGPEPDSESDEPLFEIEQDHEEPECATNKSDHEFSPESDLESGEPVEPLKRARTLQEEKDDGFCKRCGSAEQPEWILLCDKCDAGYHASCLKPMLFLIPEGDWFCPPCNHNMLIASLEAQLVKFDDLVIAVEAERERKKQEESMKKEETDDEKVKKKEEEEKSSDESESSDWSSQSSEEGAVYRLRARKQLPVSYRAQEYDRLISSAIKEEYVEATTSAGNQGRGKDISTIIEAAEEEKMKAEREAIEQGKPIEKKLKKKQRRKPRKLNSLEVPSEDDDETDEDFKDTGMLSSSEDISSSAERDSSNDSGSSDSMPLRRVCRSDNKKDRQKMRESSPEVKKKKKGIFEDSSSESAGAKEWSASSKSKSKSKSKPSKSKRREKSKKNRKRSGLTQYDAAGNVIRARVTYGGLSGEEGENDWSPKHRTRQKKINYTEMPNTESEDEMHKSSGKHMPDSSDEYKLDDSDITSDSDSDRTKRKKNEEAEEKSNEEKMKTINELIQKTAVVPLEKLPEEITKAKTEELEAHLNELAAQNSGTPASFVTPRPLRGKGSRGGRGSRGSRGARSSRGGGTSSGGGIVESPASDDALSKLIGVKIKDLRTDCSPLKHNQVEREKKRQEREAKLAEREAKRIERLQKKEEKEKMKEQKAKEREEKRLARMALQESKRVKREKMEFPGPPSLQLHGPPGPRPHHPQFGPQHGPHGQHGGPIPQQLEMRERPPVPRLQVRMELRGVLQPRADHPPNALREGTLSVAGSPQPFKPVTEEPSIITRMPHMLNQQYRGPMMYPGGGSSYGPRPPQNMPMYPIHGGMGGSRQYPPQYYQHMRGLSSHPAYQRVPFSGASSPAPNNSPHAMTRVHGPPHVPPGHGTASHGPQGPGPSLPGHGPPPGLPPAHGPPPGLPPAHGPPPGLPPGHGPPPALPPGHGPPPGLPPGHGPPPGLGHPPPRHGPPHMNLHRPQAPGSAASLSPTTSPHSLPNPGGHTGANSHGLPNVHQAGPPVSSPLAMMRPPPGLAGPSIATNRVPLAVSPSVPPRATPPVDSELPIRIKAEVKTEPEAYQSPTVSPVREPSPAPAPRDEPPRHPKIKVTDNKERRPRYPLGPYAPQYAPYGPYAPHAPDAPVSAPPYLPPHLRPLVRAPAPLFAPQYAEIVRASPAELVNSPPRLEGTVKPDSPVDRPVEVFPPRTVPPEGVTTPPPGLVRGREEGSVFGGLVSYFSSQHEDVIDA